VQAALLSHPWPGNVRELRNAIEEMVVLSTGEKLGRDALPATLQASAGAAGKDGRPGLWMPRGDSLWESLIGMPIADVEKNLIRVTLKAMGGNREKTAAALGIGERTLYRKIRELDVEGE
jgi:two-component system response regulator HydG